MNVLEIESINLEFGNKVVLSDVYLKCNTGNIVGLLGRNGAGKSSIFNIAFGMLKSQNKSIRFNHSPITEYKSKERIITYLPQKNFIPKSLKVRYIFSDFKLLVEEFLMYFPHFNSKLNVTFHQLSGGEIRLIEVYSIIKSKSFFSLLDEPFTYISPIEIETIKKILMEHKKEKGFLITDHRYQDVLDICDELYLLKNGATTLIKNSIELGKMGYI